MKPKPWVWNVVDEANRERGYPKIIVYRSRFLKLLNHPKSLRDQLILELPTLNGFRTSEVATLEWEHVDLERGDLEVLDSKKHRFLTVPVDYTVANHLEEYRVRRKAPSGLVFTPGPKAGRRRQGHMSAQSIEYTWGKWCKACGIPYMSPRYGRAYFAVDWHIVEGKSIFNLMHVLRHTNLTVTEKYLSKVTAYEDVKSEFYQGMKGPFKSECARADACPLSTDDCFCKMFVAKVETVQVQKG